jgi:glucose-1-phosphate thymidylyltransferase
MWGIIPAAGAGSRIQPLAFSKELLPVGSRIEGERERPVAVSEYLVERMTMAGADKICMVVSPDKSDIVGYYGSEVRTARIAYVVQPRPAGLCDAIFRALPFIQPDEQVLIGLPDTVWFPADGFSKLPDEGLSFLLFSVEHPEHFDAVLADDAGNVQEIRVKRLDPGTHWVWGAFKMEGRTLHDLHRLWCDRAKSDPYVGTLVNAYIGRGARVKAVRAGHAYVDVGTLHGYRQALKLLGAAL